MGDIADILGGGRRAVVSEADAILGEGRDSSGGMKEKKAKKPAGMSREVFNLIGKDGMASSVVSKKPVGFKDKREGATRTRWVWSNFKNSGRKDDAQIFYHWAKTATDHPEKDDAQIFYHWAKTATDYPDYPFARFNIATPSVDFTDEEYNEHLMDPAWTKEETADLLDICQRYDLRWPVVLDRFEQQEDKPQRTVEDLQARYYGVRKQLRLAKQAAAIAVEGGPPVPLVVQPGIDEDGDTFEHPYEKKRRKQLDLLFKRSKEEELEELKLREELKTLDTALKRVKKHPVKSIVREPQEARDATIQENLGGGVRLVPLLNEKQVPDTRPEPKAGQPYLNSTRLAIPAVPPRLQKGMLQKVKQLLLDLGLPPRPLPTKVVCDLYDDLRRDMVELFSLQKLVKQKEAQVDALRMGQDPAAVFQRNMLGTAAEGGGGGASQKQSMMMGGGLGGAGGGSFAGGTGGWLKKHQKRMGR